MEVGRSGALSSCRKKSKSCKIVAENNIISDKAVNWKQCSKEGKGDSKICACEALLASADLSKPDGAYAHNTIGIERDSRLQYDLATVAYTKAIAAERNYAWAYSNRAYSYEREGRLRQALKDAETALKLFKPAKDCEDGCDFRAETIQ